MPCDSDAPKFSRGFNSVNSDYEKESLSLIGTVALGTGVMIGAGIFALTGQIAEYAGGWFPVVFLVAAVISAFSAYTYIKVSNKYPSSGGIAMILEKAYGRTAITGGASLLMAFSMIINESLVARTFGAYTGQLFGSTSGLTISLLAVGLILFAFLVNIAGNKVIGTIANISAVLKIGGLLVFAVIALWVGGFGFKPAQAGSGVESSVGGFISGVALGILAFKGFTTITNSGGEVKDPHKNVGRAIVISLAICLVVYLLVSYGVGSSLTLEEIIVARDYSLAEAARPALGSFGLYFTVIIAIIATASGVLASIFAVSRMLAMLTKMKLIPHSHFGMPGTIQKHTLVYAVVIAGTLAALFDLSRIASIGAIFYLVMDMMIHWGVFRHLHKDVGANRTVLVTAFVLDAVVLTVFAITKGRSDLPIVIGSFVAIGLILILDKLYLANRKTSDDTHDTGGH